MSEPPLIYHQPIFDLLDEEPEVSASRLTVIDERERVCGVRFPASVREWFSVVGVGTLFSENTNENHLAELSELGVPLETAQGYLLVATENQGVVAWYVRIAEGDDPPVYDNNDEWDDDLSLTNWRLQSTTFSNFIFDMMAADHFGGWYSGIHWSATDIMPNEQQLQFLKDQFQQGPTTISDSKTYYRFFNPNGLITVRSIVSFQGTNRQAEWTIQADSRDNLLQFGRTVWQLGTLSQTLKAQSVNAQTRSVGEKVLQQLRTGKEKLKP